MSRVRAVRSVGIILLFATVALGHPLFNFNASVNNATKTFDPNTSATGAQQPSLPAAGLRSNALKKVRSVPHPMYVVATDAETPPKDREEHRVVSLPGIQTLKVAQYAGYLGVDETVNVNIFYYLFEAQKDPENAPLCLWLNGGPGSSSLLGLFAENGPYSINEDLTLSDNPNSWNKVANMLYIDQPVGTGFSYAKNASFYVENEDVLAEQLYSALVKFFDIHPQYAKLDFYIFGESYAGRYIPYLATRITEENSRAGATRPMNLVGLSTGNGWYDPVLQNTAYLEFATSHGLIDHTQERVLQSLLNGCLKLIKDASFAKAYSSCGTMISLILDWGGSFNIYDVRTNVNYEFSVEDRYMAQVAVGEAVHATVVPWHADNYSVQSALFGDVERSTLHLLGPLVEKYKFMFYNGQYDFICNFIGAQKVIRAIDWSGKAAYDQAKREIWNVDGQFAGWVKNSGHLTQVMVAHAGHLVPKSQPVAALDMFRNFVTPGNFTLDSSTDWGYDMED